MHGFIAEAAADDGDMCVAASSPWGGWKEGGPRRGRGY